MKFLFPLLISFLIPWTAFSVEIESANGNRYIENFAEAKKKLHQIYSDHQVTIYCGCKYYGKEVNMNSCESYSPGQSSRFKKLEWEHVVPAEKFGELVASWSQGDVSCQKSKKGKKGRKCAEKASPLFRQMEADMYNLYPESGGINGARSNKPPRESVGGKQTTFGKCETVIGKNAYSPRKEVRGEVARSYLYMSDTYGIPLTSEEKSMFEKWNQEDPVDAWECEKARRVHKLQGNLNKFVDEPCRQKGL